MRRQGLHSSAVVAWRLHARSCDACQTELYILEILQRDAAGQRSHLRRQDVAELFRALREREQRRRPLNTTWTWSLRFACVVMVVLVVAEFSHRNPPRRPGQSGTPAGNGPATMAPSALPAPLVPTAVADRADAGLETPTGQSVQPAGTTPGLDIHQRLHDLRERIDARRNRLMRLIEQDLGERRRLDASANTAPTALPAPV